MSLRAKTQNKRGNNQKWVENLGYVAAFKDNDSFLILDAYSGYGESYTEREDPQITIQHNGKIMFQGTFDELEKKLK